MCVCVNFRCELIKSIEARFERVVESFLIEKSKIQIQKLKRTTQTPSLLLLSRP